MAMKVKPEEVIRHEEVYSVGLNVSQRSTQHQMGFDIAVMDAVHAYRALSLKRHKTGRNDAHGLAQVVRLGAEWMKIVHVKEQAAQELCVQLTLVPGW